MRFTPGVYQLDRAPQPSSPGAGRPYVGHRHFWQRALSRRQVILSAAGGSALAASAGLLAPRLALADRTVSAVAPKPIVGTIFPDAPFHIMFPSADEPSAIGDFNGVVGAVELQGTGTGRQGGTSETLLFDADMRFMQGVYVGVDGHTHQGTFGFVWLDLFRGEFTPDFSTQVHDFNPGIHPFPSGVFWTVPIDAGSVSVNLGAGRATLSVADLHLDDYTNIPNSLSNGALIPTSPSVISFTVKWFGAQDHRIVNNPDPSFRVSGLFVDTSASIDATASNAKGFSFATNSAGQTAVTAKLGHERNGVFYGG